MVTRGRVAGTVTLLALSLAPGVGRAQRNTTAPAATAPAARNAPSGAAPTPAPTGATNGTGRGSPGTTAPYGPEASRALLDDGHPDVERPSDRPPQERPQPANFSVPAPLVAGWRDDHFFVSDASRDWFIAPGGRLQVDFHAFTPHGVADDHPGPTGDVPSGLRTGVQIRRARIELAGGVLSFLTWRLGAEFTDNGPQTAADLYVNLRVLRAVNLQLGQFDAPFTMENRTSDRYLDFPERSLAVRGLGIPTNKEIGLMVWGEDSRRIAQWSAGVFNGGGPDRFAPGNQVEGFARVFVHPFIAWTPRGLARYFQIGASARVGNRGLEGQSAYPAIATPGGFTLFDPALSPSTTLVPRGLQWGVAAEFDLPLHRFDLRGEFVYVRNATAEAQTALPGRPAAHPGTLEGFGFYTQVGYWLLGLPATSIRPGRDDTRALPGYQDPPSIRADRAQTLTLPFGLQVVGRFDTIQFAYRGDGVDPRAEGQYRVLAAEFGLNLWFTRHVRFLVGYRHYWFPDQPWETAVDVNHMQGPYDHPGGYGEFTLRSAVNL